MSTYRAHDFGDGREELVEVLVLRNKRRTECDRLAEGSHVDAFLPAFSRDFGSTCNRAGAGCEFDRAKQLQIACIDHVPRAVQAVQTVLEVRGQRVSSLE